MANQTANKWLGMLGKFFGTNELVPTYIAAVVAIVLILTQVAAIFFLGPNSGTSAKDVWQIISGPLSGALGFIFGRRVGSDK